MSNSPTPIDLACGHRQMFRVSPPVAGQAVYCRTCSEYQDVAASVQSIRVRCRDCRYGRQLGVGGETDLTTRDAEVVASRHAMRKQGHRVDVTDSDGVIKTISTRDEDQLPMEGLAEQRQDANRGHQASLRAAVDRSRSAIQPRSGGP